MMVKRLPYVVLSLLSGIIINTSCQNHAVSSEPLPADSSYFPIRQFAKDQIRAYYGVPFSLYRIAHLNNEVDSALVTFLDMEWASILPAFLATDISDRKYLGSYACAAYDDAVTGSRGYTYTATNPKLFTRLLQVNMDPYNGRVTSIYIETAKHDFFGSKAQKLLYIPLRMIQMQESEHSLFGKARNLRIDYRFMREDEEE